MWEFNWYILVSFLCKDNFILSINIKRALATILLCVFSCYLWVLQFSSTTSAGKHTVPFRKQFCKAQKTPKTLKLKRLWLSLQLHSFPFSLRILFPVSVLVFLRPPVLTCTSWDLHDKSKFGQWSSLVSFSRLVVHFAEITNWLLFLTKTNKGRE